MVGKNVKQTVLCPGYQIRSEVAIYGGGNIDEGMKVWAQFLCKVDYWQSCGGIDSGMNIWLEFGPAYGYREVES